MRIWYQQVTSNVKRPEFDRALAEMCNRVADRGTVVEIHGTPAEVGGEEYDAIRYLKVYGSRGVLANALAAERQGFDAIAIGNMLDAGLREARGLVNIPVVGALETTLHMVSMMANSFSLIASHPRFVGVWDGLIRSYGHKDRVVSIASLDVETTGYERLFSDKKFEELQLQKLVDLAKKAVAAGAELIVVPQAPFVIRLVKKGILEVDGAPIFNPIAAVIKQTELMVRYRQFTGTFISRKMTYASPPKELVDQVIARYGLQIDV